jgi:hypothetical protein
MVPDDAGDLDEWYDPSTLAALDRAARPADIRPGVTVPASGSVAGWRRGVGSAAFLSAAMLGVRDVLEPSPDEPVIEEVDLDGERHRDLAVELYFVAGHPRLTRALVRPWLLTR